jgi:hypothetical protein
LYDWIGEFESPSFWESRMWIARFLRRKSKLRSLGIICSIMLFVFRFQSWRFPAYPRATYLCKHGFQIFTGRIARIRELIPRSLDSDIRIDFIYLAHHTSLLPLVFISFRIIAILLNCEYSKPRPESFAEFTS